MKPENETKAAAVAVPDSLLVDPSLWSVDCLRSMGLVGLFEKGAKLTEREKANEMAALMWIHAKSTDPDAAEALVDAGTWRPAAKAFYRSSEALAALREVESLCYRVRELVEGIIPDGKTAGE